MKFQSQRAKLLESKRSNDMYAALAGLPPLDYGDRISGQRKLIDLIGRRFGRLLVTKRAPNRAYSSQAVWECVCDCGKVLSVVSGELRNGQRSCGCLHREETAARLTRHGLYSSPEYKIWSGMIQRCTNVKNEKFQSYGGRGITVCERWMDFPSFYADMGPRPPTLQLERRDNDKGYSLENCYWATRSQQMRNTRNTRFLTIDGRTQCVTAWAQEFGIPIDAFRYSLTKHIYK